MGGRAGGGEIEQAAKSSAAGRQWYHQYVESLPFETTLR